MSNEKVKNENYQFAGGINTKVSKYLNAENELLDLTNMNFVTAGALTKRPGTSLFLGASVAGRIGGLFEFERLNGQSYVVATANTNAYSIQSGAFNSFRSGLKDNGIFSFIPFVDRLFMGNGQDFFKFNGTNTSNYSLPAGVSGAGFGITGIYSASGGLSGTVVAGYGYVNDAGYFGPVSSGITVSLNGISFNALLYTGMTVAPGFGVSSIYLYRSAASSVNMFGTTQIGLGSSFVDFSALSANISPPYQHFTLAPQFLELYNNQMMMAGFSAFPSTVYWSDIGVPEGVQPQSFAEFRTNDGDVVRGIRAYQNNLIVCKERSTLLLSGEVPENFSIQQLTDQYGTVSNRTMVTYNNTLLFLDTKGVCQFNGANIEIISMKVEDIFSRMNVSAARNEACAIHNRQYNEIWFAFPIDGSTVNNIVIVYDYIVNAWTKYEGLNISSLATVRSSFAQKTPFFGGYSGFVSFFDPLLTSDNGAAITCLIQSRFITNYGQSIEQQFRRFFLNLDPIVGSTQPIEVNFRSNYGASNILSFTNAILQNPFQTRVDFGIPAKVLSAQIVHTSASLSFKVFGFTVESRYQRNV